MSFQTKNTLSFEKLLLRSPKCQESGSARALCVLDRPENARCSGAGGFPPIRGSSKGAFHSNRLISIQSSWRRKRCQENYCRDSNSHLKLKGANFLAKLVEPKEGELESQLALAGAPNARPGAPSAGGSEGPPAGSLGCPFGNMIFEQPLD